MIITCPHCQTKYQVTFEAIGSAGRKVQCAHCGKAWDQSPLPSAQTQDDQVFDAIAEDALDEVMVSEEKAVLAERGMSPPAAAPVEKAAAPRQPNAAEMKKRQLAFRRRQSAVSSRLPLARFRRAARFTGVLMIAGLFAGAYLGRSEIVERYPDLAGVYEAVGLGVNVVGLDFAELSTLKTLANGKDVLMVSAQIVGVERKPVPVPPVVVSLLDVQGHAVYEWSVDPRVPNLMAGERATFDTRLSQPPEEAVRVHLSFAGGDGSRLETSPEPKADPAATAPEAASPTHHEADAAAETAADTSEHH